MAVHPAGHRGHGVRAAERPVPAARALAAAHAGRHLVPGGAGHGEPRRARVSSRAPDGWPVDSGGGGGGALQACAESACVHGCRSSRNMPAPPADPARHAAAPARHQVALLPVPGDRPRAARAGAQARSRLRRAAPRALGACARGAWQACGQPGLVPRLRWRWAALPALACQTPPPCSPPRRCCAARLTWARMLCWRCCWARCCPSRLRPFQRCARGVRSGGGPRHMRWQPAGGTPERAPAWGLSSPPLPSRRARQTAAPPPLDPARALAAGHAALRIPAGLQAAAVKPWTLLVGGAHRGAAVQPRGGRGARGPTCGLSGRPRDIVGPSLSLIKPLQPPWQAGQQPGG